MAKKFKLIQDLSDNYTAQLGKELHFQVKKIDGLFNKVANGDYVKGINLDGIDLSQPIDLNKFPNYKADIDEMMDWFAKSLRLTIEEGNEKGWKLSNEKNDRIVDRLLGKTEIPEDRLKSMKSPNLKALNAFQTRKTAGMNLSDRVWKITEQLKGEIELALELGIGEGKSAAQMSRDVRKYLREPNKLFRRVRDEKGVLRLSKAAKNYHPGRGVYRSSYKNAIRLTGTENNMAYRTADHERWNQLDFVIGIEVKLSNNHTMNGRPFVDICDDLKGVYPKTFKFIGWHPMCRCFAVPKLASIEEFAEYQKELMKGGDVSKIKFNGEVKEMPENFKTWVLDNRMRYETAKNKPYFIAQNEKEVYKILHPEMSPKETLNKERTGVKSENVIQSSEKTKKVRTAEEIEKIKFDWEQRKYELNWIEENKVNVMNSGYLPSDLNTTMLEKLASNKSTSRKALIKELKFLNKQIDTYDEILGSFNYLGGEPIVDAKKYGVMKTVNAYSEIKLKLDEIGSMTLPNQVKKLNWEAQWVIDEKKNETWEIAYKLFLKHADSIETKLYQSQIDEALQEVGAYIQKSKSTIVKKLYDDSKVMVSNGESKMKILDKLKEAQKKIVALEKERDARAYKAALKAGEFGEPKTETLTRLTPDEIESMLKEYAVNTLDGMDSLLRPITEKTWSRLTIAEREVLTKYTETFSYLNEPLRGITYYGKQEMKDAFDKDLKTLTNALNKMKTPENMVVKRGVTDFEVGGKWLSDMNVGDEFVDKGFLSTSVHRRGGFIESYDMIICVPKGAKGIYAEPFSHYTDENKFSVIDQVKKIWNGRSKESIKSENEWIGQRGSKLRVIKREGDTIYFELLGQLE